MKTRITTSCLLLLLGVGLAGCSLFGEDATVFVPGETAIYEGHYAQGFEDSPFNPCGSDEQWLITFEPEEPVGVAFRERVAATLREANPMYVRLRGVPSAKGKYPGIFETYDRQFTLLEVLSVRAPRAGDCH